jgi:hypothetical protein
VRIERVLQQSVRLPKKHLHYFEETVTEEDVLPFVTVTKFDIVGFNLKYWDTFTILKKGRA